MSIIDITNTAKNHTVIALAPCKEEIRNFTYQDRPVLNGTLLKIGHDRFGFPRVREGYSRERLMQMLTHHYEEHNVVFLDDQSISIQYSAESAPVWDGHGSIIMRQPYELHIPAPIVWELEWHFGAPLREYLAGQLQADQPVEA